MTRLFEAKPYVIAEVGSNWKTLEDCLESIRVAKECGADAVKFQAFNWPALYGSKVATIDGVELKYMRMQYELDLSWLHGLRAQADEVGIEFGCTAFSPELVAAVDPYVHWHKVASSDACWPQMLEAVGKTGKDILLSTGAKSEADVRMAMEVLAQLNVDLSMVIPLYCVAAYPNDYVDLYRILKLADTVGLTDAGFSDHTLGYTSTVEAARRGATVIEKHFTAFPDLDTPDRPHSLTPAQFTRMMKLIRGEPVESEETAMYLRHNRRLIATRDVAKGETLKYGDNFGAYRSLVDDTRGLSPFDWETVEGKRATTDITRGTSIGAGDYG